MTKLKEDQKVCYKCGEVVDIKVDHHVQLHTINRPTSNDEHAYFHFQCFVDYFNSAVERKMKANLRFMQEKAMSLFQTPFLKSMLDQVEGSQIALNMLQIPMGNPVLKEEIKEKIKDGTRKPRRKAKKRKA